MKPRSIPLNSIQILRALAAGIVLLGHCFHEAEYIAERTGRPVPFTSYLDWGFGVDIFFVISGFIMIYATADQFGAPGASLTFLSRRIVRVAPLYWLTTLGILAVALVAPAFLNVPIEGWRSTLSSLLFIPDVRGNGEVRPILAVGWTLNYEMFFYAVFACCLLLPLRRGVIALTAFLVAFSLLGAIAALPTIPLTYWSNSIILEFLFGVLIGLACRSHWSLSAQNAIALTVIAFALAFALGPYWGALKMLPRFIWAGIPAAILVIAASLGPRLPNTRIVAALVVLGDASYSLYLTHPFTIRPLRNIWVAIDGGDLPLTLYVIACFAVATAGSVVVYQIIEKPMTRWLQGKTRRKPQPPDKAKMLTNLAGTPALSGDRLSR